MGFSLVAGSGGHSLVEVLRLLIAVASLVLEHRFWLLIAVASLVLEHRFWLLIAVASLVLEHRF